jgi:hypothetical protein
MSSQPKWLVNHRSLFMGDNVEVMKRLLEKGYKGQFKMIYFDGPFNSGLLFSTTQQEIGMEFIHPWNEMESIQEYLNLDLYLENYRQRIELAKELLHEEGVFVLQTNQLAGHHVKVVLDQMFGRDHFLSEVIWKHSSVPWTLPERGQFGYQHETLFFYGKTDRFFRSREFICPSVWDDIGGYEQLVEENTDYPSQKPEQLMERILTFTTQEGDLVGDFYCGSGTFPVVAERMNRRWVASDHTQQAIDITQARFSEKTSPLDVYYLNDDFNSKCLSGNQYTKRSSIPISYQELVGLESSGYPLTVNAYGFLPDVDLIRQQRFRFQYIFPKMTSEGIYGDEEVLIPRPIPVWENNDVKLIVPDPLMWVLYHLVHVKRNEFQMMQVKQGKPPVPKWLEWHELQRKAEEGVNKINHDWIQKIEHLDQTILMTDILGYKYQVLKNKDVGGA